MRTTSRHHGVDVQTQSRSSGIPSVGDVSWGSHFCQFYSSQDDLVETLVPYFACGLKSNEACLWITSDDLDADEARDRLVQACPSFDRAVDSGQIEIRDVADWYLPGQAFDQGAVLASWLAREARARGAGYDGLRLSGNTIWLHRNMWPDFMAYEAAVTRAFGRRRMLALCTYRIPSCTAQDVLDVLGTHQFALSRQGGAWRKLEHASVVIEQMKSNELRRDLENRDEFMAMLGHELRNPLAPIQAGARLLRRLDLDRDEQARVAALIERQADQLTALVNDLLDTARLSRGMLALDRAPVDLRTALERALETVQPAIAQRAQAVSARIAAEPLLVLGDMVRLTQVFANVLDNAAKFSPPHGNIEICLGADAGEAVVSVRDSGAGIDEEVLPEVFEPFVRSKRERSRLQAGLGLGLAIVRKLVEMHGGSVSAGNAATGAVIEVRLPRHRGSAQITDAASSEPPVQPRRVLIVDDNQDAGEMLTMLLAADGHSARWAPDGASALQLVADWTPDLVLLDIGLPGMDGFEVCRALRSRPLARAAAIVALTGYGGLDDRIRAAGFTAYKIKPLTPKDLTELLADCAKRPAA